MSDSMLQWHWQHEDHGAPVNMQLPLAGSAPALI